MAFDQKFLNDTFDNYYKMGMDAYNKGNITFAKRNLLLAAETLLKLASESSAELKQARMDRAVRLVDMANAMEEGTYAPQAAAPIQGAPRQPAPQQGAGQSRQQQPKSGAGAGDGEGVSEWSDARKPNVRFTDIAGLENVKRSIETRVLLPIKHPEMYKQFNKKMGGGILLYGPPGTGKTMLAKAAATEVDAKFYTVSCSDVVSKYLGEAERKIKSLFETARKEDNAIIFFDEFEAIARSRGDDNHDAMNRLLTELLVQIQGFSEPDKVLLLLAATNRPWDIDSALLRPGRFTELIYVPLPDAPAREFLLAKNIKKLPIEDDVDINWLVAETEGYSGADIDELCDRVKEGPLRKSIDAGYVIKINKQDFSETLAAVKPSVKQRDLLAFQKYIDGSYAKEIR